MSDRKALLKKVLSWGLALAALGFVAYAVPVRDQCVDPWNASTAPADKSAGPRFPKVAVSRDADGCTLHRSTSNEGGSGEEHLDPAACAALRCEPGIVSTLAGARLGWLALLMLVYIGGTGAWALRWRSLLRLADVRVSVWATWRIILESQAGGIVLPGGVGGDALRIAFLVGKGAPTATVAASVVLDRAIGLVTLASTALALATLFGGGGARALETTVLFLWSIPIAFVGGLVVLRVAYAKGLSRAPIMERRLFANVVKPVLEYVGDPRAPGAIGFALLFSLMVSVVQLVVVRGEILALGVAPTAERWVYIGTTIAFMAGSIPALPGGWGTSDAAFVSLLAYAGLASSTALAVSLIYRLFWYSAGGVGAVLFLMRNGRSHT